MLPSRLGASKSAPIPTTRQPCGRAFGYLGVVSKAKGLDLNGVVLVDKPSGLSSNAVLQKVKRLYNARKAGHTGSLDPLATGLLPICFGQATKACEYLLAADKRYQAQLRLGAVTDTYDADGTVLRHGDIDFTESHLEQVLATFRGTIEQIPPMHSALKKDGQPLYKMARRGQIIDRPARTMQVYELHAQRVDYDLLELEVHSSSGFYVRSLAYDIGEALGCGAHIVSLRRIAKQDLRVENAHTLAWLQEQTNRDYLASIVQPVDILLQHLPHVTLPEELTRRLLNGLPTFAPELEAMPLCRFYRSDRYLFGVGEINSDGRIKTHKIFVE